MQEATLLIVDDEPEILEMLVDVLRDSVPQIATAKNGKEALEKFKKGRFAAILSDIAMPEMNGLDLLEAVRQIDRSIPFVVLTGFGDKQAVIRALRLGAFDFLEKPMNTSQLRSVVKAAIESGCDVQRKSKRMGEVMGKIRPNS